MTLDPFRRRRLAPAWNPQTPERVARPAFVYANGCYVISEAGEATTWAVCHEGRWGIVYECSGVQILSAWVDALDLPLHVLAAALHGGER
jgi:hypothetical protein